MKVSKGAVREEKEAGVEREGGVGEADPGEDEGTEKVVGAEGARLDRGGKASRRAIVGASRIGQFAHRLWSLIHRAPRRVRCLK